MFPEAIKTQVDQFECKIPLSTLTIDWGHNKGHGKRLGGGMVHGGIESPKGKQNYYCVDLSEFKNETGIELLDSQPLASRYYKARKFGLDHKTSMHYALLIGRSL